MSRYINLDDDRLMQILYDNSCAEGSQAETIYKNLCEIVNTDVQPVRRGGWISGFEKFPICVKSKFEDLDADIWADWQPTYCPNCGAEMKGVGK